MLVFRFGVESIPGLGSHLPGRALPIIKLVADIVVGSLRSRLS